MNLVRTREGLKPPIMLNVKGGGGRRVLDNERLNVTSELSLAHIPRQHTHSWLIVSSHHLWAVNQL